MNDLISRQAVIESIRECAEAAHDNHEWDMEQGYLNAIECIEEEPSAEPKTGKWVQKYSNSSWFECSECGATCLGGLKSGKFFCNNCGARMTDETD